MEHYVQYHTPSQMGYGIEQVVDQPYKVYTNHPYRDPRGAVVWLVGRKSEDHQGYFLRNWFIVDRVEPGNAEFKFAYIGSTGGTLEPLPQVDQELWFRDVRGITRNFHLGLTLITKHKQVVQALMALAAAAGCPVRMI